MEPTGSNGLCRSEKCTKAPPKLGSTLQYPQPGRDMLDDTNPALPYKGP